MNVFIQQQASSSKGPSIQDVRSHGEGVVQCGQGGKGSSSDADVRTFWCKKLRIFRNLWCVRTGREGGGNFSRFCADVLYGQALMIKISQTVSSSRLHVKSIIQ